MECQQLSNYSPVSQVYLVYLVYLISCIPDIIMFNNSKVLIIMYLFADFSIFHLFIGVKVLRLVYCRVS